MRGETANKLLKLSIYKPNWSVICANREITLLTNNAFNCEDVLWANINAGVVY